MLITERLSRSLKRYIKISLVCLCMGFAGGYYTAYHKSDVQKGDYQIVYDDQQRKFCVPKEYMTPFQDINQDSSISDLLDKD